MHTSRHSLAEKIALVIKIGLWALPALPLFISTSMLFPFITGKNFAFRIGVEILFGLWMGLIAAYPEYRPRLTWLVKLSTIFIVILFLADLLSPNPARAFFSNYERMEGFMMIAHMWLYFLMLASVFKTRRDWLIFFHSTIAASIVVGLIGLLQKFGLRVSLQGGYRVDSTIGNPAYLAAYLSFHVWLLVLLVHSFWKKRALAIGYAAVLLFELLIIYFTATRGAAIALFISGVLLLVAGAAYGRVLMPARPRLRKWAVGALMIFIALPVVFSFVKNSRLIPENTVFSRLASISLRDPATQGRLAIWKMSLKGAMDRPILGWGQENYYLVFQRYYDPKLFASEPWFDRSHNIVLDWLVHAGILGAAAFFSLLVGAWYLLWDRVRRHQLDPWQGVVLATAFASYFIQDLFVFDNLNVYLLFFAFLAYTDYVTRSEETDEKHAFVPVSGAANSRFLTVASGALVIVAFAGYFLHVKPIREAKALIGALQIAQAHGSTDELVSKFREALSYRSFGDTEVREQLGNITRSIPENNRFSVEEQKRMVAFATGELRAQIATPARDIKHMLFLAAILSSAASFDPGYAKEAETILKDALQISPGKQLLYFELSQLYLRERRFDDAINVLRAAIALEPRYTQANGNLFLVGFISNKPEVMEEAAAKIDLRQVDESTMDRFGQIYLSRQDFIHARPVYEELVRKNPTRAEYRGRLAALLAELGDLEGAAKQAKIAGDLDPAFAKELPIFLDQLKQKKR